MKKTLLIALMGLMTVMTGVAAAGTDPVTLRITLRNGAVKTHKAADMDSVRFVGGRFGESGAVGMKIYLTDAAQSVDYLYSQISAVEYGEETYSLSINASAGGTVTADRTGGIAAGTAVTLTITPDSGYRLSALTVAGEDVTSAVTNGAYTFAMPAAAVTVTATFELIPVSTATTFKRITSTDDLEAGKRYIIVCENKNGAMGGVTQTNYRSIVTSGITLSNGVATVENGSEVSVFTLGTLSGYWTIYDGTYYLANNTSYQLNSLNSTAAESSKWSISINSTDYTATITNKREYSSGKHYKIVYYENGGYFDSYSNGTAVQLYKEVTDGGGETTTVATPTITPGSGSYTTSTSVSVTITCSTSGATIYYTTDGSTPTAASTKYTGAFTLTVSSTKTVKAVAVLNGVSSEVATVTYTYSTGGTTDNNVNRNALDASYNKNKYMWRLEWPHISNKPSNTTWIVKETSDYGVSLSMEWCNDSLANRWTCYQIHSGNNASTVTRYSGDFITETEIPSAYRTTHDYYTNTGYSRGHLCASADRLCSSEQNKHTFSTANIHPQWQSHNAGIWERMEEQVRKWGGYTVDKVQYTAISDTLYVVKAATIGNVTINGVTSKGVYDTKTSSSKTTVQLYVPKYFYMALLAYDKSTNKYQAIGLWTEHTNDAQSGTTIASCAITIDELEKRTGIDFFCNLPDDVEAAVESTVDLSFWGLQ